MSTDSQPSTNYLMTTAVGDLDAQRRANLDRANDIRGARSQFRRHLKRQPAPEQLVAIAELLRDAPDWALKLTLGELLQLVRGYGAERVRQTVPKLGEQLRTTTTIGVLSPARRERIARALVSRAQDHPARAHRARQAA